jgi:hypothetical protein
MLAYVIMYGFNQNYQKVLYETCPQISFPVLIRNASFLKRLLMGIAVYI